MRNHDALDRRGLLRRLLGGFGALFGALFGIPGLASLADPALKSREGAWVPAGDTGDLAEGAARRLVYEVASGWEKRKDVAYLVKRGGEILAFSARCTHLGCKVRFREGEFQCPCHGGAFDLGGRPIRKPVTEPLRMLETRRIDGRIEVKVEA